MIPESIRKVERLKNTIIQWTRNENIYIANKRVDCHYDIDRRISMNGSVVGHIIDGKYVSRGEK